MRLVAILLVIAALVSTARAAEPAVATGEPSVKSAQAEPAKVRELLGLLGDPQVQAWLEKQRAADIAAAPSSDLASSSMSHFFGTRIAAIRQHIVDLYDAIPGLPAQFARACDLFRADLQGHGGPRVLALLAVFAALGFGVEWLFRRATARVQRSFDAHPVETVGERLHLVAGRAALIAGQVTAFGLGSVGAFLAIDWPSLLGEIVLGYLVAILAIRIAIVITRFLLAPYAERFRIVPMETAAAYFWHRRIVAFVGWFFVGLATIGMLRTLGFSLEGRRLVAYGLGLGLLAIALEAVWRRPVGSAAAGEESSPLVRRFGRSAQNVLLTVGAVLLWVLWVAKAMPAFWLLAIAIFVPLAGGVIRRAVGHLLRPPGSTEAVSGAPATLVSAVLERGLRAVVIIAAIALLAWAWGIDFEALNARDTFAGRLLHGALSAVVIFLVADLLWHAAKAAIDCKLAEAGELGLPNTIENRQRTRLQTLLPIFRNVLFVVLLVVAAMMALAAMGVEIGPLIAGAGVIGVAVGFGAQGFVRDVIAGMFYLIDDAFRIGEYIQSGNYKGTVEGFSIRSVRLRHHRGPLYTVPFSLLGAVQNMSRDWVIDKLTIGITHDSNIELAKKLIRQIGQDLAKDPEFAPLIIQPLKMQGVEQFSDFSVQIRAKMMTLPGEQFVIRRTAYAMIKKAFDANGIKFAFPTVQVAGEAESPPVAAVAQRVLDLTERQNVA